METSKQTTEYRRLRQLRRGINEAIANHDLIGLKRVLGDSHNDPQRLDLNKDWVWSDRESNIEVNGGTEIPQYETFLQHSVRMNSLDIIITLLEEGADINARNRDGGTAFSTACSENVLGLVNFLIKRGADVNEPTDSGRTPLMIACVNCDVPLVKTLLEAGCNFDYTDCYGNSALHVALSAECDVRKINAVVDLLARYGCDVNQFNKNKMSAVMMAARTGNTDVIQTLLLAGCDLELVNGGHCTALCLAAKNGHTNAVRLLLQNGANPAVSDHKKISPLLHAVRSQHETVIDAILSSAQGLATIDMADYEGTTSILSSVKAACQFRDAALNSVAGDITKTLLSKGCDVNVPHLSMGWTPLFAAAMTGNCVMADILVKRGADVNIVDNVGETALHASLRASFPRLVRLLIQAGCDVNVRNKSGETALYKAVAHRNSIEVIELLVDAGTLLDATDSMFNMTALHVSQNPPVGHTEAALLLIDRGCNINHADIMGTTPLAKAINNGDSEVTKRLLSLPHCDVNAGSHAIPLHAAVNRTEEHLINQLVSLGADINKTNHQGVRPIQIAIEANQRRMIRSLLNHGCSLDPTESDKLLVPKSCCYKYHDSHPHAELQPLFAAVKYDDCELFTMLLSRHYRKPYKLLQTLHDMLTIAFDSGNRATQMLSSEGRKKLLELLRTELAIPSSLLELCRGQVRQSLGVGVFSKVQALILPTSLKHYLLFDTDRHLDLADLNDANPS